MTCTKCNGTGFVELFTSKNPCDCKTIEFDSPDSEEEEQEWSVHTPTPGNIVDSATLGIPSFEAMSSTWDDYDDPRKEIHKLKIEEETSVEDVLQYRNSGMTQNRAIEVEVDGDEVRILAGGHTLLTESKQYWAVLSGLSAWRSTPLPEEPVDDSPVSFYPPERHTKARFEVKVFSDEDGWHANLNGELDITADGSSAQEAIAAVIQQAQKSLGDSSDDQQQPL